VQYSEDKRLRKRHGQIINDDGILSAHVPKVTVGLTVKMDVLRRGFASFGVELTGQARDIIECYVFSSDLLGTRRVDFTLRSILEKRQVND
jgi:hypothetical protein